MIDDYLAAEQPIIDRLKEMVALVPDANILKAADLAGVTVKQQVTPALFLIYDGDQIPSAEDGRSPAGDEQLAQQRWMVVVAVKNAKGAEEARAEAGKIISQVLSAIPGWTPGEGFASFIRVNGYRPGYIKNFAYFPLLFSTNLLTY